MILIGIICAFVTSIAIVLFIKRRAGKLGLLQHANARSSHTLPTPTGGGLGIVVGTLLGSFIVGASDSFLLFVLIFAAVIAVLGLADDRWSLPAKMRLLVQTGMVALLVILTGAPVLLIGGQDAVWFIAVAAILVLVGVWWINLFNFMDGIDGFAATQALCMLGSSLILTLLSTTSVMTNPLFAVQLVCGTAILGFLLFNWPPAKIFMGDVGSTFLGFMIFAFAILSASANWLSLWQWIILGSVFIADATVTLLRRASVGQNIVQAHKNHAYQHLSRQLKSHRPVTLLLLAINALIVLPFALAAGFWSDFAWLLAGAIIVIFGSAAIFIGAGTK